MSRETSTLSLIGARAPPDMFISTRRNDPNHRIQQAAKACYSGLEQSIGAEEDGEQDSTSPDERSNSKRSHECVLQMSTSWPVPPRPASDFILDSGASIHAIGDRSLFSPSFWSRTPIGKAAAAAATAYKAHDGRVLAVAGVGAVSCDNFIIPNARCVPDLGTGLNHVSVKQLAECGYLSMFGGGQCSVMEESSGKIVGKGRLHADDGLYHLDFLRIPHDRQSLQ